MLRREIIAAQEQLAAACKQELTGHIIPFWNDMLDPQGGFYGLMDDQLFLHVNADKSTILQARILWFYASAYQTLRDETLLQYAVHAYLFLRDFCYDSIHGGVYWSVHADGSPCDETKYTYPQAFAIYALCAYYEACGDETALALASRIYDVLEACAKDAPGYGEAFTRLWQPTENEQILENGIPAARTTNTTLHLIEAYTELYHVTHDDEVAASLTALLDLVSDQIYDAEHTSLRMHFDADWKPLGDVHSYGHEIEASWLLDHACEVLGEMHYIKRFKQMDLALATQVMAAAFAKDALDYSIVRGITDKRRVWWVQAEGVVGFLNAFCQSGNPDFHHKALALWSFIKTKQIDRRPGSEWHAELTEDGMRMETVFGIAGPWKCPYHNGRMCLEVMKRTNPDANPVDSHKI